jgi:hypothetical protein
MLPLHHAARALSGEKAVRVAELLLKAYPAALLTQDSIGRTPLHYSVCPQHHIAVELPLMRYLLRGPKASVRLRDKDGFTALHLVARHQEELRMAVQALRILTQIDAAPLRDLDYHTCPFVIGGEKNLVFALARTDTRAAAAALQRWHDKDFGLNAPAVRRAVVNERLVAANGLPLSRLAHVDGFSTWPFLRDKPSENANGVEHGQRAVVER